MLKVLKFVLALVAVAAVVLLAVVGFQARSFDSARTRVWDVAPLDRIAASSDSAVLARGRHIADSYGSCTGCHGPDLSGGLVEDLGPLGTIYATNLTRGEGGIGAYSDAELARAIKHGIRRDGTSLLFMPTAEHNWWPDADVAAVVSFVRSVPPVDHDVPASEIGLLGKVLSGFGMLPLLSAEQVDHAAPTPDVVPAATAEYGSYLARTCQGCHGEGLSGGAIPGAPSSLPIARNLTPHETGLAGWTFAQFEAALRDGVRPDGTVLADFMPRWATLNEVEVGALWAHLQSLEPVEFGNR